MIISSQVNYKLISLNNKFNFITKFPLKVIKVNKSVDLNSETFQRNLTDGLRYAYSDAFTRASAIFFSQVSRAILESILRKEVKINLVNVNPTGRTNAENNKNIVNLRYYVLNNNELVPPEYASDAINLLSGQELAQYLNNEIETQGYVESKPREESQSNKNLWIIGAVLGPIFLLIILFWIIAFTYYKWVNPRKKSSDNEKKKLTKSTKTLVIFSPFLAI